jgi:hypothetical protein
MNPGMKKSIDHRQPFDVHGTLVMENFRDEKSSSTAQKKWDQHLMIRMHRQEIDDSGRVRGPKGTPASHRRQKKNKEKKKWPARGTEIGKDH